MTSIASLRRSKRSARYLIVLAVLFVMPPHVRAEDHSGSITNETWTLANSPHHIIGNVYVTDGGSLAIEAGCTVVFDGDYVLEIHGVLTADGNAANHVTFTSSGSSPGDWRNIYFYSADAGLSDGLLRRELRRFTVCKHLHSQFE